MPIHNKAVKKASDAVMDACWYPNKQEAPESWPQAELEAA